jgi:DNA-binding transcriptional LysR family regulator
MSSFSVSNYDLRHLRVFISIVENEGVSSAAFAEGANLSTISRDLAALETRLGMQLCRRGRGGFSLTLQGEKIYRAAKDLQSRLQLFELEVQTAKDAVSNSFNIGINDHVITNHGSGLVKAMAQMRREFPDISIGVSVHEAASIDVLVRERRVDVGVTGQPAWLQPLDYTPMFLEEHRLYIGINSPQFTEIHSAMAKDSKQIATTLPYVARTQNTAGFKDFEERYPHVVVGRCGNLESVLAAVLSGAGCALMPMKFVESLQREDLVEIPISGAPVYVQFYISYRRDTARQKDMVSFLSQFE